MGIAALQAKSAHGAAAREVGATVQADRLAHLQRQVQTFKTRLSEFASKHREDINADAELRATFTQLCADIGVDCLASSTGWWAKTLGLGDHYFSLAVRVIHACDRLCGGTAGTVPVPLLAEQLRASDRGRELSISHDDVVHAVDAVRCLGSSLRVTQINGVQHVSTTTAELSTDSTQVLALFDRAKPHPALSVQAMCAELRWETKRANAVIQALSKQGVLWWDAPTSAWWCTSMWDQRSQLTTAGDQ